MTIIRLSAHAESQIIGRQICTLDEVLSAVNRQADKIENKSAWQVKVIVKILPVRVALPDGSNGDLVIAAVDPQRQVVKTVMLERRSQVNRRSKSEPYL